MTPVEPPYDWDTAEALRKQGEQVWGCFWCRVNGEKRPYWPGPESKSLGSRLRMVGYCAACPKHYEEHG